LTRYLRDSTCAAYKRLDSPRLRRDNRLSSRGWMFFKKVGGGQGLDWSGSGWGQMVGSSKCSNELPGS